MISYILTCFLLLFNADIEKQYNTSLSDSLYRHYLDEQLEKYLILHENSVEKHNLSHYNFLRGSLSLNRGDLDKAQFWIREAELSAMNNDELLIKILNANGNLSSRLHKPEEAIVYFNRAIEIGLEIGKTEAELINSYINIVSVCQAWPERYSVDSTKSLYQKLLGIEDLKPRSTSLILNNIGLLLLEQEKFDSAVFYIEKSKAADPIISKNYSSTLSLIEAKIGQNNFEGLQVELDSLIKIAETEDQLESKGALLQLESKLLEKSGKSNDATQKLREFIDFQHDIFSKQIQESDSKFQTEIHKARSEQAEAESEIAKQRLLTSAIIFIALILAALLVLSYLISRRRALRLKLKQTETQAALDTIKARMQGEQKERAEIASVLHDQVASLLTAADMHLTVAQKQTSEDVKSLSKAEGILKDVNMQVRNLSHQLVSPTLLRFGLTIAVEQLIDQFSSDLRTITWHSTLGAKRLEKEKEVFVYQSASELIQNAIKYGKGDIEVELLLAENGIDMDLKVLNEISQQQQTVNGTKVGLGLEKISQRAVALGGSLSKGLHGNKFNANLNLPC